MLKRMTPLFAVALLLCTSVLAFAAHPHFVVGPTFTYANGVVTSTGKIAGLANADVTAVQDVTVATQCRNPGGNVAPGQNSTISTTVTGLHPENGNLVFSVATPLTVTNESAGCPNSSWTAEVVGPISAILTFYQNGVAVLSATHTF